MTELKPCPFCGGEASIDSFKHDNGVAVVCAGGCGLDTVGYWSDSHASIAERWNRRADLVDPLSDPRVKQQAAYNSEAVKALIEAGSTMADRIEYGMLGLQDAVKQWDAALRAIWED